MDKTKPLPSRMPVIRRGDLVQYRFLGRTADVETLRVLVLVMATDLEEALEAACPTEPAGAAPPG
jgi:hypothetical protein